MTWGTLECSAQCVVNKAWLITHYAITKAPNDGENLEPLTNFRPQVKYMFFLSLSLSLISLCCYSQDTPFLLHKVSSHTPNCAPIYRSEGAKRCHNHPNYLLNC